MSVVFCRTPQFAHDVFICSEIQRASAGNKLPDSRSQLRNSLPLELTYVGIIGAQRAQKMVLEMAVLPETLRWAKSAKYSLY